MSLVVVFVVDKNGAILRKAHVPTKELSIVSIYNASCSYTFDFETASASEKNAEFVIVDETTVDLYIQHASDVIVVQHVNLVEKYGHDDLPVKLHTYMLNWKLQDAYELAGQAEVHALVYKVYNSVQHANNQEFKYLTFLDNILEQGGVRPDRTGTGTVSMFGNQIRFDISKHIPILTTKFVPARLVIEELLWFMRGDTDSKILEEKNINIWKGNTSREFLDNRGLSHLPEGDIGCGYGFQWRHFGGEYIDCHTKYDASVGFDQLQNVIDLLKNDPYSRRIMLNSWNAMDLNGMALPPCHNQVQFYASPPCSISGKPSLSCHMYQRSVDTFLGFPWNILSYATMTYILAAMVDMQPGELIISTGDTHIYNDHMKQVVTQLMRTPLPWAIMKVNPDIKDKSIEEITMEDFKIFGYFSYPAIKANMSV